MLGYKPKIFRLHSAICLDDMVPQDNFYRQVEAKLDLSFVRELVKDCYASCIGRPSVDPVVFFKLHLIMFFEGIRSERQLMEMVNLNLAHRWYIGYDLDEAVPDHSSLSKIRDRYDLEVFQRFFEHIVELCRQAGLVWGKELYFDGTRVRANASMDKVEPRLEIIAKQHLDTLFPDATPDTQEPEPIPPRRLLDKYNGQRFTSRQTHWYTRTTDTKVSITDPDATPMKHSNDDRAALGYHTHYVVDGGKSRIILAALVTPASIMDNTPMLDLERWVCFRWHLSPEMAVGDTKYGTVANIVGLEQDGIRAYLPTSDLGQRSGFYPSERFHYEAERDVYVCPQGEELPLKVRRKSEQVLPYIADAATCNACPLKPECTDSKSGRHIFRSFFQAYLDRAKSYRETEAYKKALRKRQVWVEPLFGEAKQWHEGRRFRLRGLEKVNVEGVMKAAGQNIKRLLKGKTWRKPLKPAGSAALRSPFQWVFCLP
ncbi:MAG: IS1182 family transposase [Anaerolineaceae bacterium]|nr:IS1182 family transposase [Anaerolineaceae bacterium]